MKRVSANKTWKFGVVVLICAAFWLIAASLLSPSNKAIDFSAASVSSHVQSEHDIAAVIPSISNASHFVHIKQLPEWHFDAVLLSLFSVSIADDYLATESILNVWFLSKGVSRLRMSGWKDTGLQYRLINAYL